MEQIMNYIKPELLILVPVLYLLGVALKKAQTFEDKDIPLTLGVAGILLTTPWIIATADITGYKDVFMAFFAITTQGILCAGCSVYVNQIVKQSRKE